MWDIGPQWENYDVPCHTTKYRKGLTGRNHYINVDHYINVEHYTNVEFCCDQANLQICWQWRWHCLWHRSKWLFNYRQLFCVEHSQYLILRVKVRLALWLNTASLLAPVGNLKRLNIHQVTTMPFTTSRIAKNTQTPQNLMGFLNISPTNCHHERKFR